MFTLGVRRFVDGAVDAHGNPVSSFAGPVGWLVWSLAPGANVEPGAANRDLSAVEWTVFAPAGGNAPGERDRVVVDGVEFEVEGRPADWTRSPFDRNVGGLSVMLRRVEG